MTPSSGTSSKNTETEPGIDEADVHSKLVRVQRVEQNVSDAVKSTFTIAYIQSLRYLTSEKRSLPFEIVDHFDEDCCWHNLDLLRLRQGRNQQSLNQKGAIGAIRWGRDKDSVLLSSINDPTSVQLFSLVTTCMNNLELLLGSLLKWRELPSIAEIVIVDWSSKLALELLTDLDKRIRIIRVENETVYIPSVAWNLGVAYTNHPYVVVCDVNIVPSAEAFSVISEISDRGYFYHGAKDRHGDDSIVSGCEGGGSIRSLSMFSKAQFAAVNGFSEFILSGHYLYDDFYDRLRKEGFHGVEISCELYLVTAASSINYPNVYTSSYFRDIADLHLDFMNTPLTHLCRSLYTYHNHVSYKFVNKWYIINKETIVEYFIKQLIIYGVDIGHIIGIKNKIYMDEHGKMIYNNFQKMITNKIIPRKQAIEFVRDVSIGAEILPDIANVVFDYYSEFRQNNHYDLAANV